jgi:succinate dehydrogenase/fumarate reductase-like Fe-S protein
MIDIDLLTEAEIERFNDRQWVIGLDNFQVPVKVAMHILDCLDYFFSGKTVS